MRRYLQLKFAELVAHVVPRRLAYGIARRVADLHVLFDRRGREAVVGNLRRIHQHGGVTLSERALRALARENFLNFAKYVVDFFHFLRLKPERAARLLDFGPVTTALDALLAHGKGVIIVSAHLGNWELGAGAVAQRGYQFNAVALWQPDPRINALYQSYRQARHIHPIPFGRAARGCIEALRRNELIGLVGDRDYSGSRETTLFFGQPARLPHGPAKLALATGAPILPVFLVRRPDETFAYIVEPPIWADRQRDTEPEVMARIARALERVISQHSEQWYLFHNLWDLEEDRRLAGIAAFGEPPADAHE
jgi:KDO2-lipid IV(A) lauroyltransferase